MNQWPADLKTYALSLRAQGEFLKDIARAVGKSPKAVEAYFMRLARKEGVPPKPSKKGLNLYWTQDKVDRVFRLITEGNSRSQVADIMGVTKSAITGVIDRLRRGGVKVPVPDTVFKTGGSPRKPVQRVLPPRAPKQLAHPVMVPVPFLERTGCAFPVTERSPHRFCNCEVQFPTAYCAAHNAIMIKSS